MHQHRGWPSAATGSSRPIVPFARSRKGSAVYETLKRLIVLGQIRDGEPLLEIQLATRFGCSQGTVREALMRLQEDGLVLREGYRGTMVSTTTEAEAREMLALRVRLELQGLRRALPGLTASDVAALAEKVEAMEALARAGDDYGMVEADRDFHLTIFRAAELSALEPILLRCFLHVHRTSWAKPGRRRTLMEAARRHWPIVDALRNADEAGAIDAMREHILTVIEDMPLAVEEVDW